MSLPFDDLRMRHTHPVAGHYHEAFAVTLGTAMPVLLLANIVAQSQEAMAVLDDPPELDDAIRRHLRPASLRRPLVVRHAIGYWLGLAQVAINIFVFMMSLAALGAESDLIAPVVMAALVGLSVLLFLSQALIGSVRSNFIENVTSANARFAAGKAEVDREVRDLKAEIDQLRAGTDQLEAMNRVIRLLSPPSVRHGRRIRGRPTPRSDG